MSRIQYQSEAIQVTVECLFKAQRLYGLSDAWRESIELDFRNMGRTAGTASIRGGVRKLSFNEQQLCQEYIQNLLKVTIPHEVAHMVCFEKPELGRNHNHGWKRVCIALGGTGDRCHDMPLAKVRRTRKAIYEIAGTELPVGLIQHKRIQSGTIYRCNLGKIKPDHFTGRIVPA